MVSAKTLMQKNRLAISHMIRGKYKFVHRTGATLAASASTFASLFHDIETDL
jgi:hypothetical protein